MASNEMFAWLARITSYRGFNRRLCEWNIEVHLFILKRSWLSDCIRIDRAIKYEGNLQVASRRYARTSFKIAQEFIIFVVVYLEVFRNTKIASIFLST